MKQITVRGFDKQLEGRIRSLARSRGISLNRAAVVLLRRGAVLEDADQPSDVIGSSLDRFIGDWTEEEARDFENAVSIFETVDEDARKRGCASTRTPPRS